MSRQAGTAIDIPLEARVETVLVVDDDDAIRELHSVYLEGRYNIRTAASPQEAIQSLQEEVPDHILLDWKMPQGTGLDVIQYCEAAGIKTPIYVCTGTPDEAATEMNGRAIPIITKGYITRAMLLSHLTGKAEQFYPAQVQAQGLVQLHPGPTTRVQTGAERYHQPITKDLNPPRNYN
ncbi:response regulator [Candidatus Woesearchaeota archaeon]|jgi:CheY-like chemotaxis protein|nr:response regulator [Candidatus Woesearchaeota archaeon]